MGSEQLEPVRRYVPVPRCPVRPTDPCSLCQQSVKGPADCGLVYLVMSDPELREAARLAREQARRQR
ncbi:DUF6767 domain-containing protein [Austwickia chelonae]|uniref:DUF6767 domain-containing protein n=1 Tax=Austwickia chelonae TaxID=100225 RepID=UPI000E261821